MNDELGEARAGDALTENRRVRQSSEKIKSVNQLHDIRGAAQILAVSPWTVRNYIRVGKLQAIRMGRLVRVQDEALEKFIAAAKTVCGMERAVLQEESRG